MHLTIIVLTQNEARNLPSCIKSISEVSDDIHILDSGSVDATLEIARAHGLSVHEHRFESFGAQRNWAIDHIPHKYCWVFHLDADERFTPELAEEISKTLQNEPVEAGFLVSSKLMIGHHWLRYTGEYPARQMRLFHKDKVRFMDAGHGQREVTNGTLGKLQSPYLHFPLNNGLERWFEKHVRYACREARGQLRHPSSLKSDLRTIVQGPALARRRAIKRLSFRIPARGAFYLFYLLVLRLGILDGRIGIAYARLKATYETMIGACLSAGKEGADLDLDLVELHSDDQSPSCSTVGGGTEQ